MKRSTLLAFTEELQKIANSISPMEAGMMVPGIMSGYYTGKAVAGHTAAGTAPHGYKTRSEDIARRVGMVAAPVGAIAGMALARKYGLPTRAAKAVAQRFPRGLAMNPELEYEMVRGAVPAAAALGGGAAGGLVTGGLVGGAARLKNALSGKKKSKAPAGEQKTAASLSADQLRRIGEKAVKRGWSGARESQSIKRLMNRDARPAAMAAAQSNKTVAGRRIPAALDKTHVRTTPSAPAPQTPPAQVQKFGPKLKRVAVGAGLSAASMAGYGMGSQMGHAAMQPVVQPQQ
jgi:hypothetical protein